MTLLDYLNEIIGFEGVTPELQLVFAGCFLLICVRLIAGTVLAWFERIFK